MSGHAKDAPAPGRTNVVSYWLTGKERPEDINAIKGLLMDQRQDIGRRWGVVFGDPVWKERYPQTEGYPLIPLPPPHIQGPDVRLLLAESEVVGRIERVATLMTDHLNKDELERVRSAVKFGALANGLGEWSIEDCDEFINTLDFGEVESLLGKGLAHGLYDKKIITTGTH